MVSCDCLEPRCADGNSGTGRGARNGVRRAGRRPDVLDPDRVETGAKRGPVGSVLVPQQVARCRVPRERVADLLRRPLGCGVPRHVDMHDLASVMGQHDEDEQYSKRERRDHKEVDRDKLDDS